MGYSMFSHIYGCTFALANVCAVPPMLGAQQQAVDSVLLRRLAVEAVAAINPSTRNDSAAESVLFRAASIQVRLSDLTEAMNTSAILGRMPGSEATFDRLSRELVCYLLEERDLLQARRVVAPLARRDLAAGEWTRAHFAVDLNSLPRPHRKSLQILSLDTAALTAESMSIAASLENPAIATDTYLAIASAVFHRDSVTASRALRSADSARKLIGDRDLTESRQEMVAIQGFLQRNDSLASRLAATLSKPDDIYTLANAMASVKRSASPADAQRETLIEKIVRRSVELASHNPDPRVAKYVREILRAMMKYADRLTLADSLVPEAAKAPAARINTTDTLMANATAALQRGDMKEIERWVDRMSDPFRVGAQANAWEQLADRTADLPLSRILRQRAVDAIADKKPRLAERDNLLAYIAQVRLMKGYNEEAVSIVNRIDDPKEARYAIKDVGESTLAHLDAPKLRALADKLHSSEVRDQVLFRLMISMLLVRAATPEQGRWGLALVDSIRTPDLHLRARVESAKFLRSRGDSTASRAVLLSVLRNGFDGLPDNDRSTVLAFLSSLGADAELVKWARAQPGLKRAQALVAIIPFLQLKLPHSSDQRESWVSNGPDSCRDEF